MKNYDLFVLVGSENIFHRWIPYGKGRKCELLELFKGFPFCLGLEARLYLFQRTKQNKNGLKIYIDSKVICEGSLVHHMVAHRRRAWNDCLLFQIKRLEAPVCFCDRLLLSLVKLHIEIPLPLFQCLAHTLIRPQSPAKLSAFTYSTGRSSPTTIFSWLALFLLLLIYLTLCARLC